MAEQSGGEKTLPASPQKRDKARQDGKVARSQDLSAAFALLLALFTMRYFGWPMFRWMLSAMHHYFDDIDSLLPQIEDIQRLTIDALLYLVPSVGPFALIMLAGGLAANFVQVGFLLTGKPLTPDINRLNPLSGFKNLFSLRALVELFKSSIKLIIVGYIAWISVRDHAEVYVNLMALTPAVLLPTVGGLSSRCGGGFRSPSSCWECWTMGISIGSTNAA